MSQPTPIRRTLSLTALLLVLAASTGACSTSPGVSNAGEPDLVAALSRQAQAWDEAIVRKDRAAIAANMSDDFRQIRSNGTVVDRDVFLRDITSAEIVIDPYTVEDFDVRIYGDVALLCGRTRMTGRYSGEPFTTHYRYIDIYVRRDGRWKVCSVQTTAIPEPRPD